MATAASPFADVPRTARGHLGLLFYEATYRLVMHLERRARAAGNALEKVFEDFPFLADYWGELRARLPECCNREGGSAALAGECERWENAGREWLPLRALRQEASLGRESLLCLVLSGLAEEDARFAALFSALQQPLGCRRPTVGMLQVVIGGGQITGAADVWDLCRTLLECGLLEGLNPDAPRSEWALRVPPAVWSALRGELSSEPLPGTHYHAPDKFVRVHDLILPPSELDKVRQLGPLLAAGRVRTLVVRGMPGSERVEIVGSVARELDRGLLEVDVSTGGKDDRWRLLGPLCSLTRAVPVLCVELGPGESFELPALSGYRGPIAVVMDREGGLTGSAATNSVTLHVEPETAAYRLRHWQRALHGHAAEELEAIASRLALPPRYIDQAAQLATTYAALEGRKQIIMADVRRAARSISRERLDSLAARLDEGGNWAHLMVTASTENDLRSLEQRCRHREQLATVLGNGMPGGLNRGVRALFEGPSGTGKTLAARILATELGLDVYRVDLAAVVNKYIGETEKNLSRVLTRAEDVDVLLLLDEGDALMTRRTEVKSAHDRYANLETNYLLQRLETYTGIVIVTTNASNAIDSAFRRRMDVVVKFHLPNAEERWRLWQLHLPEQHAIDAAALEQIALAFALTGGQIRNAAVHATLLAVGRTEERITVDDLKGAIHVEYRKAGAAFPAEPVASANGEDGRLRGFLAAIS